MDERVWSSLDPRIQEVCELLWGNNVTGEIFQRWSQGFVFSKDEPTALVQHAGGPCVVIAPMQAFILKYITSVNHMKNIEEEELLVILAQAATDILQQSNNRKSNYYLFRLKQDSDCRLSDYDKMDFTRFHTCLEIVTQPDLEHVAIEYRNNINMYLTCNCGVILFLYSVMYTRGLDELRGELTDPQDSLIENTFGYGNQSLINLMLIGSGVSHVWDHVHDIGGLKLKGVEKQSTIGFLTLLEHLQLCEVGSFLKNPVNPIWVLGSDTHLTVVFSFEKQLVCEETPWEEARRVFKNFDNDGNNFIPVKSLPELLAALGLVAETDYVEIISKKLDSENLGIILLKDFMEEFFPEEQKRVPDMFTLWHYNGLAKSNPENKILYHKGTAIILECNVAFVVESNNILTVLQTKWPSLDIQWEDKFIPSLN